MQQKLMNVRVRCVAADPIYANNANRKFCTKYGISTSFVRKGRAAKDEPLRKVLRSELSKERPQLVPVFVRLVEEGRIQAGEREHPQPEPAAPL